jgi:Ca-activated chloride channel family protein
MSGLALLLPAGLIALISVPLVVLFHMRSPTPKAIPVPAIRFWQVAAPKPTDEPRFQRPPISASMLLHIAAALLLSLALARPVSSLALGVISSSS